LRAILKRQLTRHTSIYDDAHLVRYILEKWRLERRLACLATAILRQHFALDRQSRELSILATNLGTIDQHKWVGLGLNSAAGSRASGQQLPARLLLLFAYRDRVFGQDVGVDLRLRCESGQDALTVAGLSCGSERNIVLLKDLQGLLFLMNPRAKNCCMEEMMMAVQAPKCRAKTYLYKANDCIR
jgi:hypothetical protein